MSYGVRELLVRTGKTKVDCVGIPYVLGQRVEVKEGATLKCTDAISKRFGENGKPHEYVLAEVDGHEGLLYIRANKVEING